jgi:hypothetical protein
MWAVGNFQWNGCILTAFPHILYFRRSQLSLCPSSVLDTLSLVNRREGASAHDAAVITTTIIITIVAGSTALRGPWSSLEASASWSIKLLLLQISRQESFRGWGCQPHAQPPGYPGGPMFSVRVVSLTSPNFKAWGISLFTLAWLSHINVVQEPWCGHECNGLGRNKWHYSSFVSIHLSARCIPSRPYTTPSTPVGNYVNANKASCALATLFAEMLVAWIEHTDLYRTLPQQRNSSQRARCRVQQCAPSRQLNSFAADVASVHEAYGSLHIALCSRLGIHIDISMTCLRDNDILKIVLVIRNIIGQVITCSTHTNMC